MQPDNIRVTAVTKGEIPKAALDMLCEELLKVLRARLEGVIYTADTFSAVVICSINLVKTHKCSCYLSIVDQQDIAVSLIQSIMIPIIIDDDWLPFKSADVHALVSSCWEEPDHAAEKQVTELSRRQREGCCIIL